MLLGNKRMHTEWQWSLSGVYSIMMEKSAQPGELNLPSRTKLWCTLQLRGQIHPPYFYSTPICTVLYGEAGGERREGGLGEGGMGKKRDGKKLEREGVGNGGGTGIREG